MTSDFYKEALEEAIKNLERDITDEQNTLTGTRLDLERLQERQQDGAETVAVLLGELKRHKEILKDINDGN